MNSADQRQFVELFGRSQHRIFAFIVSLAPNWSDAEEIMSQTTLVLWEKWHHYDPQRDFVRWACGVARYEVLKYLQRLDRKHCMLSPELMERMIDESIAASDQLDARAKALEECVGQLAPRDRSVLDACYGDSVNMQQVAVHLQISSNALYLKLRRLRQLLHRCVDRTLARELAP